MLDSEYGKLRRNYTYKCLIDDMDDVQIIADGLKLKTIKLMNIYPY